MQETRRAEGPVVIGGGVIGLSVAFELACAGARPLVLERERCGAGASRVAAGMLAPASEAMLEDERLVRLGLESRRRYPDFVRRVEEASGVSSGYREAGALWVALHRDHLVELQRLADVQAEFGLPLAWLTPGEVARREPRATGRAVAGLLLPGESHVDPRALVAGLAAATGRLGGTILELRVVDGVRARGGRLVIEGRVQGERTEPRPFRVEADDVVLAAGAWTSARIDCELPGLAVRPVKGEIVRLAGECPVAELTLTPDVYLVPRAGGELVVGGTVEEQGFDPAPTVRGVHELLRRAREVVPAIDEMRIAGLDVSFRPAVRDHLPVIGPAGPPGLIVATGHHRNGILLAPVTGAAVAEMIVTGRVPDELEPFTMLPESRRAAGAGRPFEPRPASGRAPGDAP